MEREDALAFLAETRVGRDDLAAWTELARALFGTSEFLMRF